MKKLFYAVMICMIFAPIAVYAEPSSPPQIGTQTVFAQIGTPIEIVVPVEKPNVTGTVGYSVNFASLEFEMPDPPRYDKSTDALLDYIQQIKNFIDNFHQKAAYRDSVKYDTVSEIDLPKFFNFTYVPTTEGQMFLISYNHHDGDDDEETGPKDYWQGFVVVENFSKAIDQNGACKNPELLTLIKPHYSSLVCVKSGTFNELHDRWKFFLEPLRTALESTKLEPEEFRYIENNTNASKSAILHTLAETDYDIEKAIELLNNRSSLP